jgi:hypothetical protein
LEAADQLEAVEVGPPVDADAAAPVRWGEESHRLVLTDGARREPDPVRELVDGQLVAVIELCSDGHL